VSAGGISSSGSGGPLSAGVKLPPEFLEAIGALKAAIRGVKDDLRAVDKQAKEILAHGGAPDAVLSRQQAALRGAIASLEEKAEAQRAEGERVANEAVNQRRLAFLQQHISNLGMGSSTAARVIGTAQTMVNLPGDLAGVARSIGADRAAGYLKTVSKAATDFATRHAAAFGVAGVAVAVASQALGYFENREEERKLEAQATSDAAMIVQKAASEQAFGSKRAEHLLSEIRAATEQGLERAPIGWFDRLQSAIGFQTETQTESIKEKVAYVNRVTEARRMFGRSYDPAGNNAVLQKADRATALEAMSWAGRAAKAKAFFQGVNMEEFNEDRWQKHFYAAAGKDIEDEKIRRTSEQDAWNRSIQGEINRVLEHEQRRQLRTVQADNVARWNSWGMQ